MKNAAIPLFPIFFGRFGKSVYLCKISIIEGVIEENVEVIIDRWKNFFNTENVE
ncbi:MAG: hypothetical protein K2H04_06105 [Bacteroidaceae bacterium]|nr:hypothetical protein [Bacteroidaceae bacterium]